MELNYLRDFVVLAQIGNFLEAADSLYCSQSALSKHIKQLEKELGVPLFDRTTRKVTISKFGEMLLPYAKQIVSLQDQFTSVLEYHISKDQDTLTLGSIPALAQYNITEVLVNFKKTRPQSTINVIQAGSDDLLEMLRQRKCDLAFIRLIDQDVEDIIKIPFAADYMVALVPASHKFSNQQSIDLKQLADENFVLIEKNSMLYNLSMKLCELSGFNPKIIHTDHMIENLIDMVVKEMGVALLMKNLACNLKNPQIKIVEFTPRIMTDICICHLKGIELTSAVKQFKQCAIDSRDKNLAMLNIGC